MDILGETLDDFFDDFGVHEHFTFYGFQSQVGKNAKLNKNLRRYKIDRRVSAPCQPNENPDEGSIREIKRRFNRTIEIKRVTKQIWYYQAEYIFETENLSVLRSLYNREQTVLVIIAGETSDIS